jgi:WD repeat and SOF domain-containing protein 1
MKIRTISRTEEDFSRKTKLDISKVHRNRDPALHPFERAREYTKAIVATKLDKIFAKPFVGALDGHKDGVYCTAIVRSKNVPFISGSCDGEIRVWDLARKKCFWSYIAHAGFVRGVAPDAQGSTFFSCGDDKMIKQWQLQPDDLTEQNIRPINTIVAPHALSSIDHHWVDSVFATSGEAVCVWDNTRATPVHSYKWGSDSLLCVRFNPAEACLLASTDNARAVSLYDLRSSQPLKKFLLAGNSNKVCWNPREPFNFVLANEDNNLYSFDMRNLDRALMVHKDHVSAVMDVAFSPTGREFASGGYDRMLRIFNSNSGRSRDVYHTKRMGRIFSINYSVDAQYIISGSDETNIRLWKAQASQSLGVDKARDERKKLYNDTIKRRFAHMPELRHIAHNNHVPKSVKKAKSIEHIQKTSERRKTENRKRHSADEDISLQPERKKAVVKTFD